MAVPPDLDFGSLTTLPVWLRVLGARDLPNSLSRTRSPTRKSVVTTICCFNFSGCSIAAKALIARPSLSMVLQAGRPYYVPGGREPWNWMPHFFAIDACSTATICPFI